MFFEQNRRAEAVAVLERIYPPHQLQQEVQELQAAVDADIEERSISGFSGMKKMLSSKPIRLALTAGVGLQVNGQSCLQHTSRLLFVNNILML